MDFSILKLVVGELHTNCYLYYKKTTKSCMIIDPGDDVEYIISKISDLDLNPKLIVATHGHFDHILAVDQLKKIYHIPFYINKEDEFLVKSMNKRANKWLSRKIYEFNPIIDRTLKNSLKFGNDLLEIIHTPGHTPGSVCIYDKKEKFIFSGDTMFSEGYTGRYDFSYSNKLHLEKSIKLILQLSNETKIYPGHGSQTSVGKEKDFHK